ncbi:hypothetical protein AQUCO_02300054v1 [Aquilegia coerulea]|uniref:Uncharacterized protein n=1 Tax=Aquilegia coerulea TaxID=218851 RepID=A0A2G5DBV1_AQUCA|nr:hypothetical protein AQUCO_02300054v1 [Aquilegia coerulea]
MLAFQLLIPTVGNNGTCDSAAYLMTQLLLLLLASLLPLLTGLNHQMGNFITAMWLFDYPTGVLARLPDLSNTNAGCKNNHQMGKFYTLVLSVFVFVAIALRDTNVLQCFYPQPGQETQQILTIALVGIDLLHFIVCCFSNKKTWHKLPC